ncbi:MAG: HD domain-containing protein [Anaerolineae bacterium]|nr:HD domain-containing protein [Anaerolineae bacterium]
MEQTEPDFAQAIEYALQRLATELPPYLTYHNLWHTQEDVLPAAVRLARLTGIPEADIDLLRVAAAYHDIGYLYVVQEHEMVGASIAAQLLPDFGFSWPQIERVINLIMATRIPQTPDNLLEQCLADADLDALGRDDFLQRSEALRLETAALGQPFDLLAWDARQLGFLQTHHYFTAAARSLREATKQKHIVLLKAKIGG